jgi:hypothetical protein
MRKYLAAYALWLLGVLSAAALAAYYYRRILAMGDEALAREFRVAPGPDGDARPPVPLAPTPPEAEHDPGFEDTESIEDARPPSFEDVARRRRGGGVQS